MEAAPAGNVPSSRRSFRDPKCATRSPLEYAHVRSSPAGTNASMLSIPASVSRSSRSSAAKTPALERREASSSARTDSNKRRSHRSKRRAAPADRDAARRTKGTAVAAAAKDPITTGSASSIGAATPSAVPPLLQRRDRSGALGSLGSLVLRRKRPRRVAGHAFAGGDVARHDRTRAGQRTVAD